VSRLGPTERAPHPHWRWPAHDTIPAAAHRGRGSAILVTGPNWNTAITPHVPNVPAPVPNTRDDHRYHWRGRQVMVTPIIVVPGRTATAFGENIRCRVRLGRTGRKIGR
jgi:hypothetical protein